MNSYSDNLRKVRSLLIVTSLQKRVDLKVFQELKNLNIKLDWSSLPELMIDNETWEYVTQEKSYDPKLIFCHPEVLKTFPKSSLYYRGLTGLSIKAAKDYIGSIENMEKGKVRARIDDKKAIKIARVYNTFVCSIILGSVNWTLDNGKRTIIATLGITLDGIMRNKIGSIAEERVRALIVEWLNKKELIVTIETESDELLTEYELKNNVIMRFSSEPDISFISKNEEAEELVAIVEIKGGIDPAGALERYGAATKSFQHALTVSQRCKNFFLSAVYTPELIKRIKNDRLVEKNYDIIEILEDTKVRENFFSELFHYCLRIT